MDIRNKLKKATPKLSNDASYATFYLEYTDTPRLYGTNDNEHFECVAEWGGHTSFGFSDHKTAAIDLGELIFLMSRSHKKEGTIKLELLSEESK